MNKNTEQANAIEQIGGVSLAFLKQKYDTPLQILDQEHFEDRCELFKTHFKSPIETEIAYASKAHLNLHIAQTIAQKGLSFDVASMGELYILQEAGVDLRKVYFHGNNKLEKELRYAIEHQVGHIVLDNIDEANLLMTLLEEYETQQAVLIRVNPTVHTNTHEYIKTSEVDSKFGIALKDPQLFALIEALNKHHYIHLDGFHAHIGSQIFEKASFYEAATTLLAFYRKIEDQYQLDLSILNLGGGFGVAYTESDPHLDLGTFLSEYAQRVAAEITAYDLPIKKIVIEPGRSLINQSMHTLYTVGSQKMTLSGKQYVFVDGGMSDNIRPALYQADYSANVFTNNTQETTYTIAGKLCESGDVLIENHKDKLPEKDDLILIKNTGAYTMSMSSNYNKMLRPALVAVKNGQDQLVVRRETLADLIRLDVV